MNTSQKYFNDIHDAAQRPRPELHRRLETALANRGDKIGSSEWRAWQDARNVLKAHDDHYSVPDVAKVRGWTRSRFSRFLIHPRHLMPA